MYTDMCGEIHKWISNSIEATVGSHTDVWYMYLSSSISSLCFRHCVLWTHLLCSYWYYALYNLTQNIWNISPHFTVAHYSFNNSRILIVNITIFIYHTLIIIKSTFCTMFPWNIYLQFFFKFFPFFHK